MKKLLFVCLLVPTIATSQVDIDSKSLLSQAGGLLGGKSNTGDVLLNRVAGSVEANLQSTLTNIFSNTEVSITGVREGKPTIGIITVRPFYESTDLRDTVFGQFSFFNTDGRQTINAGLGYRRLSNDKKWLYGINTFFDQEFPYNHQRSSLGLELRSSIFEVNTNQYYSMSEWKSGKDGIQERALGGSDMEFGLVLPYMPGAKIYRKYYKWNAYDGVEDIKGDVTSLEVNGDILFPGLKLEIGVNDVKDGKKSEYARLIYRYQPGYKKSPSLFSEYAYQFNSMEGKRLEKVRRTNTIVKQFAGDFIVEVN